MNPVLVAAGMELAKSLLESTLRYSQGELSETELRAEWAAIDRQIADANEKWESAGH